MSTLLSGRALSEAWNDCVLDALLEKEGWQSDMYLYTVPRQMMRQRHDVSASLAETRRMVTASLLELRLAGLAERKSGLHRASR